MINNISPKQAFDLLSSDVLLIDVREADEFKAGHIANAISIPLSQLEEGLQQLKVAEDKTVVVHCLKGQRSDMACKKMMALGMKNPLFNVAGGFDQWKRDNLPVLAHAQKQEKISIFRQVQMIVGALIVFCTLIGFLGMNLGFVLAAVLGLALFFAGASGFCGMAILLMKMPWNRP